MADADAREETRDDVNHEIPLQRTEHFLPELMYKIAENVTEPSTVYLSNLDVIYSHPKQDCINHLRQMPADRISLFREQMFYAFLDHFDERTLIENGFTITEQDIKLHLRKRTKPLNAVYDIYNMGLSLHEDTIITKLASEFFKPGPEVNNKCTILDSHSALILEKLQEVLDTNSTLRKENADLRNHLKNIENKLDKIMASNSNRGTLNLHHQHTTMSNNNKPNHNTDPLSSTNLSNSKQTHPLHPPSHNLTRNDHLKPPKRLYNVVAAQKVEQHKASMLHCETTEKQDQNQAKEESAKNKVTNKTVIYGGKRANKNNITGTSKPFSLFVGGFDPNLDISSVRQFVEKETGLTVVNIESNRVNKYNQSFKIDINAADKAKAFHSDRWFEGLVVKPYRTPRTTNRYNENYNNKYNIYEDLRYDDSLNDSHNNWSASNDHHSGYSYNRYDH